MNDQSNAAAGRLGRDLNDAEESISLGITQRAAWPKRANVLGIGISVISMDDAIRLSDELIQSGNRGYICATDVHTVIEAQTDSALASALNRSFLTTPDGMPLVWVAKLQGHRDIERVYGPDYMLAMCRFSVARGYRHFLFGGHPGVAERLRAEMVGRFPGLQIVGHYTPPFRQLTRDEEEELAQLVAEAKPDVFWVGLGSPKQELFMAKYCGLLDVKLMVGVGAAFDFHSGRVKEAPEWIKKTGLQWIYRLIKEPRRLWRRYYSCVPSFIWNITLQLTGMKAYRRTD